MAGVRTIPNAHTDANQAIGVEHQAPACCHQDRAWCARARFQSLQSDASCASGRPCRCRRSHRLCQTGPLSQHQPGSQSLPPPSDHLHQPLSAPEPAGDPWRRSRTQRPAAVADLLTLQLSSARLGISRRLGVGIPTDCLPDCADQTIHQCSDSPIECLASQVSRRPSYRPKSHGRHRVFRRPG